MEDHDPVILQGHMDMVCEKDADCPIDMATDGLDVTHDGTCVFAKGTTLGGDDGIALAYAMALLADKSIPHPPLEVIITVDEEIGMLGAAGLDVSMLQGRRLLNLDSEEEGVFTVSCAGGNRTTCRIPVKRQMCPWATLRITVGGLEGGHSGVEIHKGRGNANLLLGRVLAAAARETGLRLIHVEGGGKDNAIPREAAALLAAEDPRKVADVAAQMDAALKNEYRVTDGGVFVTTEQAESALLPMEEESTARVLTFLSCVPDGVQAMSADIPGLVQTSLNLGILKTAEEEVTAAFALRSSVESQKTMLVHRLERLTAALGGSAKAVGDYPAWAYRADSPLRELMTEVFTEQYGHAPKIEAIHAGLECGLFAGKLPGLDCVSIGPDLTEIHTTREKMHISSVRRVWEMTVEVLRRMK